MKTFLRNLLGTTTTPARKAARLGCEALEAREVPAGLNAVLASGVLTVTGTPGNDAIRVVQSPDTATYGSIRVDGTTIRVNGQARASVPDYLVTKVVENGGAGNDALSFVRAYRTAGKAVNPAVAAVLDGGTGDNKYPNGNYNDIVIDPVLTQGRAVMKTVLDKWVSTGGVAGALGKPTADYRVLPGGAHAARFQRGDIYWSAATGTRVVFGAVRDKYNALGGAAGFLGLPTGDLTFVWAGIMTRFQGGDIYWSGATGAHVVYGDILTKFNALGGVGFCGFPVSDEVAVPGGRASFFEDADIYWSAATGAHEVHGGFRDRYNALGGAGSRLGLPIDELRYNIDQRGHQFAGAYWYQDFQYGQL